MQDQIFLLESRKEVTTFLLDDGEVISKEVITQTGKDIGFEYTNKLFPEDIVSISSKSEIGKEMVKKYSSGDVPIGIIANNPTVMDNGQRKAIVLVLGQLYRLKLASGVSDIAPADKIRLGEEGAVKDSSGEFLALHPVEDSDEYNYVNCFKLATGGSGEKGDTGPAEPKGDTGESIEVYKDKAHREIIFSGAETSVTITFDEITGPKGDTGPVNLASSLDTTDNTNAIKNAQVTIAIENLQTSIGSIISTQTANLNLLGS